MSECVVFEGVWGDCFQSEREKVTSQVLFVSRAVASYKVPYEAKNVEDRKNVHRSH